MPSRLADNATPSLRRKRRLLRWLAIGASLLALAAIVHVPVLRMAAAAMSVTTPQLRADLIVPLYGDPAALVPATVKLLENGSGERIALYEVAPSRLEARGIVAPQHRIWQELLEAQGAPHQDIVILPRRVNGRRQLGEAILEFSAQRPVRVTVVASRHRSRIAWIDLKRAFAGMPITLQIHPVRSSTINEDLWWRSSAGFLTYFDSYCLYLLRWIR